MSNKQVITFHDLAVFPHPEWFTEKYVRWRRSLIPLLANKAEGIITVSEFSKSIILEFVDVDESKIKVIYNGVNRDQFFEASNKQIQETKRHFGINKKYILTLGSLDPRKNLEGILKAWSLLDKKNVLSNYELLIVGGKGRNFAQELSSNTLNEDMIKYLGYVDDKYLAPLYSGAVGFVYPSFFEGFGLPVLEAMSCGTPVVTSNRGALKEITSDSAWLVDPEDYESIAEGILQLIESPTNTLEVKEKYKNHAKNFSWEKTAVQTYNYLKQFEA